MYKYIKYDSKSNTFSRTRDRPCNQAKPDVLAHIRKRLIKVLSEYKVNENIDHTQVQKLFVDVTDIYGRFQKGHSLGKDRIDIVHSQTLKSPF